MNLKVLLPLLWAILLCANAHAQTDKTPINHLQVIGSHNSYKKAMKGNVALIKNLVEKGYIVRTRADSDTQEARANDKSAFEAALQSGAQIITTDYYRKSTHFDSEYIIRFEGGGFSRENLLFTGKR
ncbi:hypothetical protein KK062_09005 [Fulvivirgaceae bacterium PWU5]|uniref:Uncharacterized protein n=1 Tax=Dawidia cretensis TaxID=2782350 RepID=A0AAP2DVY1_9BACT|nr:Ca2+-dependent phosphoinositide-specific phospholipase C [Dawidia cretensis]MBT1708361.1 hypothetical protein [Dawidia cretensis]